MQKAISLEEGGPRFDYLHCLNCGACTRICPSGIVEKASGYRLLAGGKLGRHPRLADIVAEMADEKQLFSVLEGLARLYLDQGREGERLGGLVERLGIERVRSLLVGKL
ncbi:MAG: 4Fe-4S binding protein [Desulfocucumaceae bacterium]